MTGNQIKPLLTEVPGGGSWRDVAIIGGTREDDGALAAGYFEAADILVKHWEAHRPNDLLALPILFNYRHGIELALKDGIRAAAQCARRDNIKDPDLDPEKLNAKLAFTHSLGDLVQRLVDVLDRLGLGEGERLPPDTIEVLRSLHALDESGQTFRYATVKVGRRKALKFDPARPEQVHFDLPAVAALLDEVATILLYGVSGVLYQYSEYQDAMREAAGEFDYYYG